MENKNLEIKRRRFRDSLKLFLLIGLCVVTSAQAVAAPENEGNYSDGNQSVSKTITGTIKDTSGEPLIGVTVAIQGTTQGVISDFDGNFTIVVPSEESVLQFSFVGYLTETIPVAGKTTISLVMTEDVMEMGEVVVTAMGIKRQSRALGYSMSKIDSKQLTESGATSFTSALYGKAAGVKITTAPGGVTSASNVQIRGINSLNYNQQPLYVVDGVIIRNDAQYGASGANNNNYWDDQRIRGNGALDINPNDIESLNVLKGASATALYGSDAASGVIVITTKKGSQKKKGLGVDFGYNYSVDKVAYTPKFQNSYGPGYYREYTSTSSAFNADGWYIDSSAEGGLRPYWAAYAGFGPKFDGRDVSWWDGSTGKYSANPSNYDDIYRTGTTSNANLAISNANENVNYRFTYSRLDYKGTQEGSEQGKNTLGLNSTFKLSDKVSVDVNANFINTKTTNRPYQLGQVLGSFSGFFSRAEDMSLMKQKFQTSNGYKYDAYGGTSYSPDEFVYSIRATNLLDFFWQQMRNKYVEKENRLISSGTLNWDIVDGLHFRGRIGNDFTGLNSENKQYNQVPTSANSSSSSTGSYSVTTGIYNVLYTDLLLSYNKKVNADLDLSATAGFQSREESYKDESSATTSGLVTENWFSLNNSYGTLSTSYTRKELLKYAYVGILSLNYKNYFFLEGTARQEYASTLPEKNNSYFYPSVNGSLVFSDVFNLPQFWNYGKFRASYGVVGNAPPAYESNVVYTQTSLQTVNGSVPQLTLDSSWGNNNLKAEMKHEFEIGFETQFINNRLGIDVSYYENTVKDQILDLATTVSTGASSQLVNVGEIGSNGLELSLNITPIVNNDWKWDARFNWSTNTSKVKNLNTTSKELVFYTAEQSAIKLVAAEGEKLGNIYVYGKAKDEDGNYLISDDGLYVVDNSKYVKAGNIMPDFVGGFSNTVKYKNISLDFNIDYRIGGKMISPSMKYMTGAGLLANSMKYRDSDHGGLTYEFNGATYDDGVLLEGKNENTGLDNTQVISAGYYYMNNYDWGAVPGNSDGAILDNSYIKMREVTLAYRLPAAISDKVGLSNVRFSLYGRNLFYLYRTLENLDPEAPLGNKWWATGVDVGSTAASRSFGFSVNASF